VRETVDKAALTKQRYHWRAMLIALMSVASYLIGTPSTSPAAKLVYVTVGGGCGHLPLTAVHAVQHCIAALVHLVITPSTHTSLRRGEWCGVPSCLSIHIIFGMFKKNAAVVTTRVLSGTSIQTINTFWTQHRPTSEWH
jgi:hypothetical protein